MAKVSEIISSRDDEAPRRGNQRRRVNRNGRVIKLEDDNNTPYEEDLEAIEQMLSEVNFDNMDRDDILSEIQKVDKELLRINYSLARLSKTGRHVFKGDSDALNLQLRALKQRSDMLFKCLDKVMPDKRESKIDLNLNTTETDQIPTHVLQKIALGTITEEEYEHYSHLFAKDEKQRKH